MSTIRERIFLALTSGSDGVRAHYDKLPAKGDPNYIMPATVIQVIAGHDEQTLRGADGLCQAIVQIDAYAGGRLLADELAALVKTKLRAARTFTTGTISKAAAPPYDYDAALYRESLEMPIGYVE